MDPTAPSQGCFKCDAANKYGTDSTNQTCKPCIDQNCSDCSNDRTKCATCGLGFQVFGNGCIANCKIGQTLDKTKGCVDCTTLNCATCPQAFDVCEKCKDNFALVNNKCTISCGVGFLKSSDGLSCLPCN
jgi:hypothetical protein